MNSIRSRGSTGARSRRRSTPSLYPIVSAYTEKLAKVLRDAGFKNELLIGNCVGGMMPPDEIIRRPIYSVMSGPTLAPIAGMHLTSADNVIVVDMGGTTFDVSALRNRQLVVTPEATFGMEMLGIPKIDVRSVGAGGGSIAWVDAGGLLKVGPQSAGARPGPACYGLGGTEADGHRRQCRARHHRPRLLSRRQDQAGSRKSRGGGRQDRGKAEARVSRRRPTPSTPPAITT